MGHPIRNAVIALVVLMLVLAAILIPLWALQGGGQKQEPARTAPTPTGG